MPELSALLLPTPGSLQTQFLHEEKICLPLGAVIGAITGACVEQSACAASSAGCQSSPSTPHIAGIMNERWRPAPGGGGGGRPTESDSDVGGAGGSGGRSIFGFGDERSASGSGGRSGAGGAFGEERAAAPRGDGFGGAASSSVFRDHDTSPAPGEGHGGSRRLVGGGGGAADADDFDPFKQKLARE